MEYTKGEWEFKREEYIVYDVFSSIEAGDIKICYLKKPHYIPDTGDRTWYNKSVETMKANAHLIAAAPLGHELAEFVAHMSGTWIEEGAIEIGEGDYTRMKQLALAFISKAKGDK